MALTVFYGVVLVSYTILSWAFVDGNVPLPKIPSLNEIIYFQTMYPVIWYTAEVTLLFVSYIFLLRRIRLGHISSKTVWRLIAGTTAILIFSYPALSNDIFNYVATAKVAFFWKENPYIIMPIDIPNEPMLSYLHAANKVALYWPVWILLTLLPHSIGLGNLLLTLFTFKAFIVFWYLFLCYLIWIGSDKKPHALAFFALNPLVTLSTLGDGHNDVVMMGLALGAFLWLKRNRYLGSFILIIASIGIKGATIFLLPVYFWCFVRKRLKKSVSWQSVWYMASISMYVIFFLSPLREEMYAWYFIWPLVFLALVDEATILHAAAYGFSLGLLLRIVPFFYTRSWVGSTPFVKKIVTIVPPIISIFFYDKKHSR